MIGSQNNTDILSEKENNSTVSMSTVAMTTIPVKDSCEAEYNHTLAYIFILLGVLLVMALLVFVVSTVSTQGRSSSRLYAYVVHCSEILI